MDSGPNGRRRSFSIDRRLAVADQGARQLEPLARPLRSTSEEGLKDAD